jgi:uncharacterized protein YfaS (alpha-2-macroglobulin family)
MDFKARPNPVNRAFAVLLAVLLLLIGFAAFMPHAAADPPPERTLTFTLPRSAVPGDGAVSVELLNASDRVIASRTLPAAAHDATGWRVRLAIPARLKSDDLAWYRLRLVPAPARPGGATVIRPMSEYLEFPVLKLLGQREWASGTPGALRVLAVDGRSGAPLSGTLTLELRAGERLLVLEKIPLDRHGTAQPRLDFPADFSGAAILKVSADTPLGSRSESEPITIVRREHILLTTDKPLYQPGHLIHIRSLALDRFSRLPAARQPIVFEIEDGKGNKVFKQRGVTDAFGVASAQFQLAEEVNLGTFKLRAILGSEEGSKQTTEEKSFTVDRYVLPKFKLEFRLGEAAMSETGRAQKYYAPGENVTGVLRAHYLFGKPIVHAKVNLKLATFDVQTVELANKTLQTDDQGEIHFSLPLPAAFAGRPLDQGAAPVALEAEVTDSANHSELRAESLLVSAHPILITAVPESGEIIPRLSNRVYLRATDPAGSPVQAMIRGNFTERAIETDAGGFAVVSWNGDKTEGLQLSAETRDGKHGAAAIPLARRNTGEAALLLRTGKSLYKVGDPLDLEIYSSRKSGAIYLDVIKERQTILTRALDLENGKTGATIHLTPDLTGTIEVRVYQFGANADPVGDRRLIFVDPADELKIDTTMVKHSFRPGEEAAIDIHVTDAAGRGQSAILDVQVVDEAVFALAQRQPGFEKVFFQLEQELLKPRYEIHGISPEEIVPGKITADPAKLAQREQSARLLFAAATEITPFTLRAESSRDLTSAKADLYFTRYHQRIGAQVNRVIQGMNRWYAAKHPDSPDFNKDIQAAAAAGYIDPADRLDPWGQPIHFQGWRNGNQLYANCWASGPGNRNYYFNTNGRRTRQKDGRQEFFELDRIAGVEGGVVGGTVGGVMGGIAEDRIDMAARPMALAAPASAPALRAFKMRDLEKTKQDADKKETASSAVTNEESGGEAAPRVRSWFPETLYVNPALITDGEGRATIRIPLADSITTWRMSMLASNRAGAMGSASAPLTVFQDFFVDLDLPVALTRDDVVTVPVAVYNYLGEAHDVTVTLKRDEWFSLVNDEPVKSVRVAAGEVGSVNFRLRAGRIGKQSLMVTAKLDRASAANGDAVSREIEVVPNGEMQNIVINDRLEKTVTQEINFPANALPDASKILVKFYPGPLSQAVEGLDSILRMPGGCFEQTSSSTYPNVLVMDYMKTTKKITPEIQAKAEGYISLGYQRLVTFEVPGGGFSWFGQAPANKILTGYGLMEFADMAKVHEVDPRLIQRTQQWLASQQQADGGWVADKEFINEGATNNFNTDRVRIAAYIGWSLAASGYQGPAVAKAKQFIESHLTGKEDAYTLAVLANFAVDGKLDATFTNKMIDNLARAATEDGKTAFWKAEGQTPTYARGDSAAIETTALAAQALIKSGKQSNLATKTLAFLTAKKDAFGNWNTTQATIHSLRAFLLAQKNGSSSDTRGMIRVTLNGEPAGEIEITADNAELMHQLDLKDKTQPGRNVIGLQFSGKGSLLYQIIGRHYLPWHPAGETGEPLSIAVAYDRTQLLQNDIAAATVTIRNNLHTNADMVMIDLGIPPGFELMSEDLQEQLNKGSGRFGHLTKFTATAKQAILYFDGLSPAQSLSLKYRLRAKYPIRARTFASKVYEYYNPEVKATAVPVNITVAEKK